ncbi:hypothetical protein HWV62_14122 [Athelia sp. TMB]|nr:hypothetical protein HWV62_14122 [Athelia sp. TMB]
MSSPMLKPFLLIDSEYQRELEAETPNIWHNRFTAPRAERIGITLMQRAFNAAEEERRLRGGSPLRIHTDVAWDMRCGSFRFGPANGVVAHKLPSQIFDEIEEIKKWRAAFAPCAIEAADSANFIEPEAVLERTSVVHESDSGSTLSEILGDLDFDVSTSTSSLVGTPSPTTELAEEDGEDIEDERSGNGDIPVGLGLTADAQEDNEPVCVLPQDFHLLILTSFRIQQALEKVLTEAPGLLHSAWLAANARAAAAEVDAPRSADLHSAWLAVNAHAAAAAAEADDAVSAVDPVTPAVLAPPPSRARSNNRLSMIIEESEAESEGSDTWSVTTPEHWSPETEMAPASPASAADSASMSDSSSQASDTWSVTTPNYGAPDNEVDSRAPAEVAEDEATSRSILGEEEQNTEEFIAWLIRGCPFFTASLRNSKHIFIKVVNNIAEVDRSPPVTFWDSVLRLFLGNSGVSRQWSAFQANFVQRYEDDTAEENLWLTAIRSDKTAFTSVINGRNEKSVSQLSVWGSFCSFFWNSSPPSHRVPSYKDGQFNVDFAGCFDGGFEG